MTGLARGFFVSAILYSLLGFMLGLQMAMSHDHAQLPTHAHIMVIGWLSFAVFGFFYHLFGAAAAPLLSKIHFWLAQASFAVLTAGLWLYYGGGAEYEPVAAIGAMSYAASFLVFAAAAWPVLGKS